MTPMGDGAWRASLPAGGHPAGILAALRNVPGVIDAVVADGLALVSFDPSAPPDAAIVRDCLAGIRTTASPTPRHHTLRARYDGEDLPSIAALCGVSTNEVIAMHSGTTYTVEVIGFLPGFGYLGPMCPELARIPRRRSPRLRVPPRAVGIAAGRTGVYPVASPGGWHIVATAVDFVAWDPTLGAALALGDHVRFVAV